MTPSDNNVIAAARKAAQAWRAAVAYRKQARVMEPADEFEFFDTPTTRVVSLGSNTDTLVAPQNPLRVAISFSTVGAPVGGVFVRAGTPQVSATGSGFPMPTSNIPLSFTQADYGNLVQVEWHGQVIGATGTIYVTEVVYRTWGRQ